MSFLDDNIIETLKSQEKIKRITNRIKYKESLCEPVSRVFLGNTYRATANEKIKRFSECGKYLEINPETGHIYKANFCKERLCPVCNYLKSCNNWRKIKLTIDDIRENNTQTQFVFMSLTVKNCTPEDLKKTIDELLQGFRRLTNRKTWKKCILGTLRGLEITYNPKENTFHPHIHILACVPNTYFSENYITIDQLRKWWQESARLDYFVQVDIRKTTGDNEAISEVAKYSIKTAEVLNANSSDQKITAVKKMHLATYGRRLIATTGVFKETMKKLNIGDLEEITERDNAESETIKLIWNESSEEFKTWEV